MISKASLHERKTGKKRLLKIPFIKTYLLITGMLGESMIFKHLWV